MKIVVLAGFNITKIQPPPFKKKNSSILICLIKYIVVRSPVKLNSTFFYIYKSTKKYEIPQYIIHALLYLWAILFPAVPGILNNIQDNSRDIILTIIWQLEKIQPVSSTYTIKYKLV